MAQFTVDKGVKVFIASTVNAAYRQRFAIFRQKNSHPGWWERMGKPIYFGGETQTFPQFSEETTWKIICQYDYENGSNWRDSKEKFSGGGTNQMTILCDDTPNGDLDYNDLIVRINLSESSGTYSDSINAYININNVRESVGDGIYKQYFIPKVPHPEIGKNQIEP